MHGIVVSIREASLVIRQQDEAILQVSKFTAFVSAGRTLDEFAALGCFRAILLRFITDKSHEPRGDATPNKPRTAPLPFSDDLPQ
jgi:hypothetical protein